MASDDFISFPVDLKSLHGKKVRYIFTLKASGITFFDSEVEGTATIDVASNAAGQYRVVLILCNENSGSEDSGRLSYVLTRKLVSALEPTSGKNEEGYRLEATISASDWPIA